ncbi:MAG: antibiotic biosynthesis monooxygenase [Chloroflexi bacterium]|nr:antibiotic biosynthesis monooxygenase [Chloroflexota bacterium]
MYARIATVQIQPGKLDEAVRIFQDSVVPAAKRQKGFKSIMLMTDRNTGKGVSVAVWETEADMKANEASGYLQEQFAKFGALFAAPPVVERYELAAQA